MEFIYAMDLNKAQKLSLAKMKNTNPDMLDFLGHDRNADVRLAVMRNPRTFLETRIDMVQCHPQDATSYMALARYSQNRDVLRALSRSHNQRLRLMLSLNPRATAEILEELSKEPVGHIRMNVYQHPNTSDATKAFLKPRLSNLLVGT